MSEKLRTIRLYGKLGARFGRVHQFVCGDPAGAIRALCGMVPGFKEFLMTSQERGLGYAVFIGRQNLAEDQLCYPAGGDDIRIAPMVLGRGGGGLFQIILGVAMVAGAFFTGGATLAAGSLAFSGVAGMAAVALGAGFFLSGVAQMLVKQPKGNVGVESPDNKASYNFNGPTNVSAQGNPVPVLYGEAITGSATTSGDMYSEDLQ